MLTLAATVGSFGDLAINASQLFSFDAATQMWNYSVRFFPPDFSRECLAQIWSGTLETIAIPAIGTLRAAVFGMPIALPASGRFGSVARMPAR